MCCLSWYAAPCLAVMGCLHKRLDVELQNLWIPISLQRHYESHFCVLHDCYWYFACQKIHALCILLDKDSWPFLRTACTNWWSVHIPFSHKTKCSPTYSVNSAHHQSQSYSTAPPSTWHHPTPSQGHFLLQLWRMMGKPRVCLSLASFSWKMVGEGEANPCRSITGTKCCLLTKVLTHEQTKSQGTSLQSWRTGRQLSSVSPLQLKNLHHPVKSEESSVDKTKENGESTNFYEHVEGFYIPYSF